MNTVVGRVCVLETEEIGFLRVNVPSSDVDVVTTTYIKPGSPDKYVSIFLKKESTDHIRLCSKLLFHYDYYERFTKFSQGPTTLNDCICSVDLQNSFWQRQFERQGRKFEPMQTDKYINMRTTVDIATILDIIGLHQEDDTVDTKPYVVTNKQT